jgi:hypothetical protein
MTIGRPEKPYYKTYTYDGYRIIVIRPLEGTSGPVVRFRVVAPDGRSRVLTYDVTELGLSEDRPIDWPAFLKTDGDRLVEDIEWYLGILSRREYRRAYGG